MNAKIVVFLAAAAAVANAEYYCYNNPNRGSDNVIPYSVGVATVTTTVQRTGGNLGVDWSSVQCYLYYSYVASDAQGHPLSSTWSTPLTSGMARSSAHGGNMWTGTLALRNESVLEVVSYCLAQGQQLWCGGSEGNIIFRMPPTAHHTRAAARDAGVRVYTNPNAGSDNVIPVSNGLATLTTTVEGASDLSRVQCFAWYGNVPATDDGHLLSNRWDPVLSMVQARIDYSNRFSAQIPITVGHVLQATSYCLVDGQRVWAAGNANFRISPEQQHPAGSLTIRRDLSTTPGYFSLPASASFYLHIASQFQAPSPAAGSRCVARFGYPARFGAAWPTVNETLLSFAASTSGADQWSGNVPLPAAGGLLEVTARCVYNGIESWLGANYQVQAY
eukprot:m51a1_g13677 hypothetical protein (389) ;mRNA; r:153-1846